MCVCPRQSLRRSSKLKVAFLVTNKIRPRDFWRMEASCIAPAAAVPFPPPLPHGAIEEQVHALHNATLIPPDECLRRLRAVGAKLRRGCAVRVAALGGSSTAGHQLKRDSPLLYHAQLLAWFNATFPHPDHILVNSGTPATGPEYMEKCFAYQIPAKPDVVLVEYAQNIARPEDELALERLLRALLQLPSQPAVLMVELPSIEEVRKADYTLGEEARLEPLAQHYAVPSVSMYKLLDALGRPVSMGNRGVASLHAAARTAQRSQILPTAAGYRATSAAAVGVARTAGGAGGGATLTHSLAATRSALASLAGGEKPKNGAAAAHGTAAVAARPSAAAATTAVSTVSTVSTAASTGAVAEAAHRETAGSNASDAADVTPPVFADDREGIPIGNPSKEGHELIALGLAHVFRYAWGGGVEATETPRDRLSAAVPPLPLELSATGDSGGAGARAGGRRKRQDVAAEAPAGSLTQTIDFAAARDGLPPPLWQRSTDGRAVANYEMPAAQCIGGTELQPLVRRASRWDFVTEGSAAHPKPGLVSQGVGASLRLCYPLQRVCEAAGCPAFGANRTAKVAVVRCRVSILRCNRSNVT